MEPLDDKELSELLRRWEAPAAPPGLKRRVLTRRGSWWRWLLTGTICVPVPVGGATVVLLALWIYSSVPARPPATPPAASVSLADFQPVEQLEPMIIRSGNENK